MTTRRSAPNAIVRVSTAVRPGKRVVSTTRKRRAGMASRSGWSDGRRLPTKCSGLAWTSAWPSAESQPAS